MSRDRKNGVPLDWVDVSLLGAVLSCGVQEPRSSLVDVILELAWKDGEMASLEMVRWGVPRLEAAGWISSEIDEDGDLWLRPTERGREPYRRFPKSDSRFDYRGGDAEWLARELRVPMDWGAKPSGDRSLGHLPGFTNAAYARAQAECARWFEEQMNEPIVWEMPNGEIVDLGRPGEITREGLERLDEALDRALEADR